MTKSSNVIALRPKKPIRGLYPRPMPPTDLGVIREDGTAEHFRPAPEVMSWVNLALLDEASPLHNPDHMHLQDADIACLWAWSAFDKAQKVVVGSAEQLMLRAGGWQKARMEEPFLRWFGRVPAFLITLAADYCLQTDEVGWCALIEHELYHIAQAKDEHGSPKFSKDGQPSLCIRGHDVEEFTGVVARYGVGRPDSAVAKMVEAAQRRPLFSGGDVAHACGTCLTMAA